MKAGRWVGAAVAVGMVVLSIGLAMARPPETNEAREARIHKLYAGFKKTFSGVPDVQPVELEALRSAEDVVLVDVRTPEEQAVSMIPGAIPAEAFEADPKALEGKVVVAYCTIGARSGTWAKEQRQRGIDARNLAGSLLAYTHAGLPLEHEGEPTKKVHTWGATWNLVRLDYEPVW